MSTPEYRLAPANVPAVGMGLYTRRPYHKSELIFTEGPLVRVPHKSSQPFMKQLWRHVANGISSHPIVNAFKGMSRYDQKDFLRLHNSRKMLLTRADYCTPSLNADERIYGPTCAFELLGIYLTNFFFLHEDLTGVFKSISRVNHACAANAYLVWDRTNSEMRVVAASTIVSAGTEITIDYSEKFAKQGMFKMLENIREHCRYFYGFWCRCKFCLDNLSRGSIQEITPEQEREMISFHLDEVEEKLLLRQEERCWEIKELWSGDSPASSRDTRPMGELGMFATRRISRGEPIHGESPIFTLEFHQDQLKGTYIPSVVKAVRDLDLADRDAFLALGMRDPRVSGLSVKGTSDINRLKEIFLANAICLPEFCEKGGYCEWGVFQDLSRVNHSCMPSSVGLTHNRKLRGTGQCQYWLHARRDIEPGEEITVCYVETVCAEADVTVRARALKDRFICWCQRCAHGRQGTSRMQKDTHFDGSEIPEEYPKLWVERINALPVAISDRIEEQQHLCRKMKKKATQPSLVFGDVLIELNSISKQGQIFCAAKKAGKSIGNGIGSLPFILDDARQVVLGLGKRKKIQDKKEILQRRIKFTDSSCTMESAETSQLGGKGKHAAGWPPSTDWATMAAIVLRHNPEEANWGSGDNLPFGRGGSINSAIGSDSRSVYPASTSTKLWELAGGRINQSQKAVSVLHRGDPGLSDQMLRLGTEPTAERLRRTHNLALDHGHMGPGGPTDSRSAHYVNQSDGASDISSNSAVLRNEVFAVLTGGESSMTDDRTFNTGSTRRVGNLAGSASSSTVTVIRRPTREGSMNGEDVSPVSREAAYPVARAHERYRGTSYTLDNGFLGPRSLCMDVGGEGLGSRSSGLSIRNSTGAETVASRGQLPIRGTYQAPDGNYSTSRTDQDRRLSGGGQFRAPSRRVQSGPLPPRGSSQSFLAVPHHPVRGRGPPSGSSYTYGLGDQRDQRTLSHERNWPTGNTGSTGRHAAPRSHKSGRQQFSGPGSDGAVRDTRPKMMENYRLSSGNQPGGAEDHVRQGQLRDEVSVGERGINLSDQRHQRPQSMAESFHGRRGIEEPLEQDEGIPEDIKQLAQRARNLLNRARTNIALPISAPEGPVDFGVGVQDTSQSCLNSIAQIIEDKSLPGTVDSEEFSKAVEIAACVRAPMLDTTRSLHWKRSEFPEDDSPQSPIDNGDTVDVLVSQKVNAQTGQNFPTSGNRFSLGCDDLPESNPTVYCGAHEGLANLELGLSTAQGHDGRLLEKRDTPNNWLPAVTSQVGGLFDELRPRLIENDNPHAPARPQPEWAVTK